MKHKGVYFRGGVAYIRYQDERGHDIRESTKQRSARAAEDILAKRRTEVAMRLHFPTRAFDDVGFSELAEDLVAGARLEDAEPVSVSLSDECSRTSASAARERSRPTPSTRFWTTWPPSANPDRCPRRA